MPATSRHPDDGPELLREILSRLFTARGWGRRQARLHLEKTWNEAVGKRNAPHTRVNGIRRGILEVEVRSGIVLQELAHFQKKKLLQEMRRLLPDTEVKDIRFKAGNWAD